MRVLVACEFSGLVRNAFAEWGHDAWSCDLLPTELPGQHYEADIRDVLLLQWDLMIAHPPCTHLASSGARWFQEKPLEQIQALTFVEMLLNAPIPRIALENPVSIISTRIRPPDQIIQPFHFGNGETKATCLWLKNLPPLKPNHFGVMGRRPRVHYMSQSPDRGHERSRTIYGIAAAMAQQWGSLPPLKEPTPMSDQIETAFQTAQRLQDLRSRALSGEEISPEEYRDIIDSIRRARLSASSPLLKPKKQTLDLNNLPDL